MGKRNARRRSWIKRALRGGAALLMAAVIVGGGIAPVIDFPAFASVSSCPPSNIWLHTGRQSPNELFEMRPNGTTVSSHLLGSYDEPLPELGDIAFTPDGTQLAAVDFGNSAPHLYLIDPTTGLQTGVAATITGALPPLTWNGVAYVYQFNALSTYQNGYLFASAATSNPAHEGWVYQLTSNAISSYWGRFPAVGGQQLVSGGDFLTLPGGDVIGIGARPGATDLSYLVRFPAAAPMNPIVLGTVPLTFGAALSGGQIFLAAAGGQVLRVASVPTGGGTSPISTVLVANMGRTLFGAASLQDGGTCAVEPTTSYTVEKRVAPSTVAKAGDILTYSVTVRNSGETAYPAGSATFADNLRDVLDDAALVPGSITSSAGAATITGNTLAWAGPLTLRGTPGATVTVAYKVQVASGGNSGNYSLKNSVVPTGPNGTCVVPGACSTTVAVQKLKTYSVRKSASTAGPVGGGTTVSYQIVVTNTGVEAYPDGGATFRDNLADVLDDATLVGTPQASSGSVVFDPATKSLAWSGALGVATNTSATITYSVQTLTTSTGNQSLVNTVIPTGVGGSCVAGSCSVTIAVLPEWSVKKTASVNGGPATTSGTTLPGDTIDYTVTATGVRGTVSGARLHDAMSDVLDDATFVSGSFRISGGSTTTISPQSGTLTSPQFTLTPGSAAVMSYRVTVKPSAWMARITNAAYGAGVVAPNRCIGPDSIECFTTHTTGALLGVEKLRRTLGSNVEPVSGATFAILTDAVGQPGAVASAYPVVASSAVGQYSVRGIPAGTYWLQETAAPPGQQLLAQPVPFTVAPTGAVSLGSGSPQVTVIGSTIRVVDVAAFTLPASGGPGRIFFYLIGGAVLLVTVLAAGISTARKRKRSRLGTTEPS